MQLTLRTALALLVTGLAAPLAPGATAPQEAVQEPILEAPAEDPSLARDLERVLLLSNGQHMRARAYFEDGQWLVKRPNGWAPFPASYVRSQETVKSLLSEARKRERSLKMARPDDRADQALWLIERGLYQEALAHVEFNLRKDPDHGPSLTLVTGGRLPMKLPYLARPDAEAAEGTNPWAAAVTDYLKSVAPMGRASREIALASLAEQVPLDDLAPILSGELLHSSSARRELAAQGLQRMVVPTLAAAEGEHDQAATIVRRLTDRAVLDGSDEVRGTSTRALRDLHQEAVVQPFVKALGSSSSAVRANAAEALGGLGHANAAPALVAALAATSRSAAGDISRAPAHHIFFGKQLAYVQDYDVEAFAGAVAADPQINVITEGVVLDVRILSMRTEIQRAHERASLRTALGNLTGQDFRYNHAKWSAWLAENPVLE